MIVGGIVAKGHIRRGELRAASNAAGDEVDAQLRARALGQQARNERLRDALDAVAHEGAAVGAREVHQEREDLQDQQGLQDHQIQDLKRMFVKSNHHLVKLKG